MDILLLNPPRFNELVGKNPGIIEENRGYNPPLGVLSLASTLRAQPSNKYNVKVLDCQPQQLSYKQIERYFVENNFDVVGITAMSFTLIDVVKTVKIIKKIQKNCKVVLGGAHVHIYPNETLQLGNIDYVIQGEGEYSFIKLLEAIEGVGSLETIQGLAYKKNGVIINNDISPKIEDLDNIPMIDRTLLPIEHYGSLLGRHKLVTTMFTSRGCPYRCTFCDRPSSPTLTGFRWRSAKNVVDEMEDCSRLGIKEILIYDDTFSVRKNRVMEICEEIIKRNIKISWDVRAHVNTVNKDMLQMMKKAGCDRIHYGVEAGNDRMLEVVQKASTIKRVKKAFKETKAAGIEALAYFMIGLPEETIDDIQDIHRLAKELKPDYCHFTIFCPYPDTAIYRQGLEKGVIKKDHWKEFAKNPTEDFELPIWDENFSRKELQEMLVALYKDFYLRPGYILSRIFKIKTLGELKRKTRAGISVLKMKAHEVDKLDLTKALKVKNIEIFTK